MNIDRKQFFDLYREEFGPLNQFQVDKLNRILDQLDPMTPEPTSVSKRHTINDAGLQLIKESEGLELEAYLDAANVWTIGYGHTNTAKPGQKITETQAEQLLREDLREAEEAVTRLVTVPLTENQFAALVSFVFNLGAGRLAQSTLLAVLNRGEYGLAAREFDKWVYAGGRKLSGLVTRRSRERELFSR